MNIPVKIIGMTRIRNEQEIIQDTLDHFAEFCNAGIVVFDDCSTDDTARICKSHPAVKQVTINLTWNTTVKGRWRAEGKQRQAVHDLARQYKPEWLFYFDADERIEFDFENFDYGAYDCVSLKLFDYYITPEDVGKHWSERRWLGPEYRRIPMLFREHPDLFFINRAPKMPKGCRVYQGGYVKHYGKAISVEQWEATCEYYTKYFGELYRPKWEHRKGKAVHDGISDFKSPLILWSEKAEKGFVLSNKHRELEFK